MHDGDDLADVTLYQQIIRSLMYLVTGYTATLEGNTICWYSRKQRVTATSMVESEYIALSVAASQQQWLQLALHDLETYEYQTTGSLASSEFKFYVTSIFLYET